MPTREVYAGSRGVETFIGRMEPATVALASERHECPVQLHRSAAEQIEASAPSGQKRTGKPADVKPGLHWLLVPREKGGYHLQPVSGWYEFAKPMTNSAAPAISCARPLVLSSGEAELRRDAKQRQELADRWAGVLDRRAARSGVKVKSGKAMDLLVPDEGDVVIRGKKAKVFQPDDERLSDEMGLRKQKKKQSKAMQKQAGAVNNAEDIEDVPDTANALLQLKVDKGEAGWDVDDGDLFSDDEQEPCDFDGNLDVPDPNEVEAGLSADEEDANDEEKDLLTSHGKQLENLMENVDEEFESHLQPMNDSESDAEYVDRPMKKTKNKPSAPSASMSVPQSSSSKSLAAPVLNQKQTEQSTDRVKQSAIDFLRQNGGKCALKDMSKVLNLSKLKKSAHTEEYQRVVEILKEVSIVNGTELTLNEQYQEHHIAKAGASKSAGETLPKSTAKLKASASDERTERFESVVMSFVKALHKKGFKSRLQAAEYLEGKTKGTKGLTELEVSEILRRFCSESPMQ